MKKIKLSNCSAYTCVHRDHDVGCRKKGVVLDHNGICMFFYPREKCLSEVVEEQ